MPFGQFSPPKPQPPKTQPDLLADPFAGGDLLAPAAPAPAPAPPLLDPIFSGMTNAPAPDPFAPPPPKKGRRPARGSTGTHRNEGRPLRGPLRESSPKGGGHVQDRRHGRGVRVLRVWETE